MPHSTIQTEISAAGIAIVKLNRPEVHNAFNEVLIAELTAELEQLRADGQVRAVILTGAGRSFCAGADLDWMRRTAAYSHEENLADALKAAGMLRTLDEFPKPTVAAVHGAAFGGGVGLVACCDIAIASENATFSFSEVRLGLIPAVISPYVITAIGERAARRYFLTAEKFPAAEARRIGLVHEVTAQASLGAAVDAVVGELLSGGPDSLRAAKKLIRDVAHRVGDASLPADTARVIAEVRGGAEAREGIQAFLQKRKPAWTADGQKEPRHEQREEGQDEKPSGS
jgi:methylglutaconyl-CoA hydratase